MPINEYDEILQNGNERQGSVNEYDSFIANENESKKTDIKSNLFIAADKLPDRQAEILKLSQETGLPSVVVDRQYDALKKKRLVEGQDYDSLVRNNPGVSKFLSNPDNAALAKNEINQLAGVEKSIFKLKGASGPSEFSEFGSDVSGAFQTGYNNLAASTYSLAAAYGKVPIEDVAQNIADYNKRAQDIASKKPDYATEWQAIVQKEGGDVGKAFSQLAGSIPKYLEGKKFEAIKDFVEGDVKTVGELLDLIWSATNSKNKLKGLLYTTTESLAYSFPSIATGMIGAKAGALIGPLTGPAAPVMTPILTTAGFAAGTFTGSVATETASWINDQMGQRGFDMTNPQDIISAYSDPKMLADIKSEAERKGIGTAAVDALFSVFAGKIKIGKAATNFEKVASKVADVGVQMAGESASEASGQLAAYKGDVSKLDAGEILMEGMASLGHSMGEIAASPVTHFRQEFAARPDQAMDEIAVKTQSAFETAQQIQALQQVGSQLKELKDLHKVPGKVQELVDIASEGSESNSVYFQPDEWDGYWNKKGLSPSKAADQLTGDGGKSYFEAKENGTPIEIPLGKFLETTATTEHFDELTGITRVNPDGMTLQEAKAHFNELPNLINQVAKESSEAQAKSTEQSALYESQASEIRTQVEQQLKEAGMSATDAKLQAQVYEERIKRRAEIRGVAPELLWRDLGLNINRIDQVTPAEGKVFNQADYEYNPEDGEFKFGSAEANVALRSQDMLEDLAPGLGDHVGGEALEINTLEVPPNEQNKGVGSEAIKRIESVARNEGQEYIVLKAEPLSSPLVGQNDGANLDKLIKFYERNGFSIYKQNDDNAIMVKEVSPSPGESKDSSNIYFQGNEVAGPFYSKMQQTLEQKMGNKATVAQVRAIVKDMKADELKWSGLDEFLKGKDKVDKEELLDYLRANQIQIVDVTLSAENNVKIARSLPSYQEHIRLDLEKNPDLTIEEAEERALDSATGRAGGASYPNLDQQLRKEFREATGDNESRVSKPKFEQYTLPGGENYREVLFTMPPKAMDTSARDAEMLRLAEVIEQDKKLNKDAIEKSNAFIHALRSRDDVSEKTIKEIKNKIRFGTDIRRTGTQNENQIKAISEALALLPGDTKLAEMFESSVNAWMKQTKHSPIAYRAKNKLREISAGVSANAYKSSHFDQENILAHIRLKDRTDAYGKKVLFVEEIQSDWHQDGRKKGYKEDNSSVANEIARLEKEMNDLAEQYKPMPIGTPGRKELTAKYIELQNQKTKLENADYKKSRAVPDAPFQKTWHEFAFKKILRMAADGNYDRVAWTTGEQQAERFDLSKEVESVNVKKTADDAYDISVKPLDGGTRQQIASDVKAENLSDFIGKDLAEKVVKDSKGEASGIYTYKDVDLKVGGEGMKGFYDNILVKYANKFGKKFGARVGETDIIAGEIKSANLFEMDSYEGMPAEVKQRYGTSLDPRLEIQEMIDGTARFVDFNTRKTEKEFQSIGEARDAISFLTNREKNQTEKVHSLDITPELKKTALEQGFELFQDAKGRIRIGEGKINIDLFKTANFSTLLHETGHLWLEEMKSDYAVIKSMTGPLTKEQGQFIKDAEAVLAHFKVDSFDQITVEMHEEWARLAESYFMEGKAPSEKLRKAFARFKIWLTAVYRKLANLNVQMSQDIREVMNRLLASDQEISEVTEAQSLTPLFDDARSVGMSEAEAERYQNTALEARGAAEEILSKKLVDEWTRQETKFWKEERAKVKAQVESEVNQYRVYKTLDALRYQSMIDGTPLKLSRQTLVELFDAEFVKRLPKPFIYVREGGLHPEIAAGALGYESADQMLTEIANAPRKADLINSMTDERMGEKYPPLLTDPKKMKAEALKTVHNDQYSQMLRLELEYLAKQDLPTLKNVVKKLTRRLPSDSEIKAQATRIIGERKLKDVKPYIYLRAEAKAAKQAGELFAKGDIAGAFEAKRKQLINFLLYQEALNAESEIAKAKDRYKKLRQKDEKLAKTRDINFINAARAILSSYGIGQVDKSPNDFLAQLKEYDPEAYSFIGEIVNQAMKPANQPIDSVTYGQFKDMDLAISSLWDLSKSSNQIEVDGRKVKLADARAELIFGLEKFVKSHEIKAYQKAAGKWEKAKKSLLSIKAWGRRVEHWVDAMDGGDINGVFRKYVWNPISEASDEFTTVKAQYLKRFKDLTEGIDLGREPIKSDELGYEFKNKGEILGAMLHIGNESNMAKLLLGRNWGKLLADGETLDKTKWNSFMDRMHKEGVIAKADYDFVQSVWDMMAELKPMAQKAHKHIFGHYFSEITTRPLETPFGEYKGGYAPAAVDSFIVDDIGTKQDKEAMINGNNSYAYPAAGGRGFTKSRVKNYNKPLTLDIRLFGRHLDQALKFAIIKPHVVEVTRLLLNDDFKEAMALVDPTIVSDMLTPYLQRADKQLVQNPIESHGAKGVARVINYLRRNAAMQIMFANMGNVVEQITGLSVAAVRMPLRNLRDGLWTTLRSPKRIISDISEKSPFMAQRFENQVFELTKLTDDIIEEKNKFERAQDFAVKHMYIFQAAFQNVLDPMIWQGAYNHAIEQGQTERQAVMAADSTVRLTQNSMRPIDISRVEAVPFIKVFQMFYSFFNNMANLNASEFNKIVHSDLALKKKYRRGLYVYLMVTVIPTMISEMIRRATTGDFDEDDDDEYLTEYMGAFLGGQVRMGTAAFPIVGSVIQTGFNQYNDKWYDDKVSASPAFTAIPQVIGAPKSLYQMVSQDRVSKRSIKDAFNAVGLMTGLPLGTVAKPLGYLTEVSQGKANPTGPIDFSRGLITGKSGK